MDEFRVKRFDYDKSTYFYVLIYIYKLKFLLCFYSSYSQEDVKLLITHYQSQIS